MPGSEAGREGMAPVRRFHVNRNHYFARRNDGGRAWCLCAFFYALDQTTPRAIASVHGRCATGDGEIEEHTVCESRRYRY